MIPAEHCHSLLVSISMAALLFLPASSHVTAAIPGSRGAGQEPAASQPQRTPAICIGHESKSSKAVVVAQVHNATVFFVGDAPLARGVTLTCAPAVEVALYNVAGAFSPIHVLPAMTMAAVQSADINRPKKGKKQAVMHMVSNYISQLYLDHPEPSSTLRAAILLSEEGGSVTYLLHQFQPESNQINFYYHSAAPGGAATVSTPRRSLSAAAACPKGFCKILPKLPPGCNPKAKNYPACTKSCVCK